MLKWQLGTVQSLVRVRSLVHWSITLDKELGPDQNCWLPSPHTFTFHILGRFWDRDCFYSGWIRKHWAGGFWKSKSIHPQDDENTVWEVLRGTLYTLSLVGTGIWDCAGLFPLGWKSTSTTCICSRHNFAYILAVRSQSWSQEHCRHKKSVICMLRNP